MSSAYRSAISLLVGMDLMALPMEVNAFRYGPSAKLGAHLDLADKLVTQTVYFNAEWDAASGGCLPILRSKDVADTEVTPLVGNAAILVRSTSSWHAVSPVIIGSASQRSLAATFYRPGSPSAMWPLGDATSLHRYDG